MGEVNVHSQNHGINPNSPLQKHKQEVVEPTDMFSTMHRRPPCSAPNNPMKRRSPPFSSSSGDPCAKKLFCDQDDLSLCGFSAVPIPINLSSLVNKRPVLRRCVSDPYRAPAPNSPLPPRGSGLPPLPPSLTRCVSDLSSPTPRMNSEETAAPDSVRLRKMKQRLKEMRRWWDEVMKDEEEEDGGGGEEECAVAEDEKVLVQDDLGGGESEEAVRVEWAEKCVSLGLRCPCGKGYEVLLSENNCYYKLV